MQPLELLRAMKISMEEVQQKDLQPTTISGSFLISKVCPVSKPSLSF